MRTMLVLALLAFAMPAYAANHAVQIKGMKFNPSKISVAVGDTITFTNADAMTHTATALDGFSAYSSTPQAPSTSAMAGPALM